MSNEINNCKVVVDVPETNQSMNSPNEYKEIRKGEICILYESHVYYDHFVIKI